MNVGIGTTRPLDDVNLTVGAVGSSGTTVHVFSEAKFAGIATVNNLTVTGFSTVVGNYDIQNSSGKITTGIVTTGTLNVGTGGTVVSADSETGTFAIGSESTSITATMNGGTIPSVGLVIALGG